MDQGAVHRVLGSFSFLVALKNKHIWASKQSCLLLAAAINGAVPKTNSVGSRPLPSYLHRVQ